MRFLCWVFVSLLPVAAAPPLLHQDFEKGTEGWMVPGSGGKIGITRELLDVKSGKSALAFQYEAGHGLQVAALPVAAGKLAGARSFRFWFKSDSATPVALVLSEAAPGGKYTATFWSPRETWQHIELFPEDFAPSQGPDDPVDRDGKLDLAQVNSLGLLDLGLVLRVPAEKESPILIEPAEGKHAFYVDDFEIAGDGPPPARRDPLLIDDFSREHLDWFTLGGMDLSLDKSGTVAHGPALKIGYSQSFDKFPVVTHQFGPRDVSAANYLAFDIASEQPANLVFSLQERLAGKPEGPRYSTEVEVPGGRKWAHREVPLAAFAFDTGGPPDANGKLDLDSLKSLTILDVIGAESEDAIPNRIWLGNIRFTAK